MLKLHPGSLLVFTVSTKLFGKTNNSKMYNSLVSLRVCNRIKSFKNLCIASTCYLFFKLYSKKKHASWSDARANVDGATVTDRSIVPSLAIANAALVTWLVVLSAKVENLKQQLIGVRLDCMPAGYS